LEKFPRDFPILGKTTGSPFQSAFATATADKSLEKAAKLARADPCRLVRQVKKFRGWDALASQLPLRWGQPTGGGYTHALE
jgi:hypothetical protein